MPSRSKPASTQYFALSKMAHIYTDFQPSIEWTQDAKNNVLRIYLPGFRKDEFRVQVDNSGKLTVKGRRPLGDGKFMHLERVFAVPKDSHTDKISGKFESGCLSLFMPKKEVPKTAEPPMPVPRMPSPPQPIQEAEPAADDMKEEAPIQKDQPKSSARKEEEPIQKVKAKDGEEIKAAAPVHEERPLTDEKKEEHLIQDEPIRKKKPTSSAASDDRFEKCKKTGLAWKETIEEGVERWLDYGLMDGLLETIKKNKEVIAVAVAAFSAGFYVSGKLRSSGR